MIKTIAVVPAAGRGRRMNTGIKKQYLELQGVPVIARTIRKLQDSPCVTEIFLVTGEDETEYCREIVEEYQLVKVTKIVGGGDTRQRSVGNALQVMPADTDYVIVHDGVRPLADKQMIEEVFAAACEDGAAVAAVPVKDTIKIADNKQIIRDTLERSRLWAVQTPQIFSYNIITDAYRQAEADGFTGTDDASLAERIGHKVKLVQGSYSNIKITTPEDLIIAEAFIKNM